MIGGPDRDRTDDLFHAMEARSQLRHRPTRREGLYLFWMSERYSSNRGRELIWYVSVSKGYRVSEHSAAGGAGLFTLYLSFRYLPDVS
jgi:hypothetical protein